MSTSGRGGRWRTVLALMGFGFAAAGCNMSGRSASEARDPTTGLSRASRPAGGTDMPSAEDERPDARGPEFNPLSAEE